MVGSGERVVESCTGPEVGVDSGTLSEEAHGTWWTSSLHFHVNVPSWTGVTSLRVSKVSLRDEGCLQSQSTSHGVRIYLNLSIVVYRNSLRTWSFLSQVLCVLSFPRTSSVCNVLLFFWRIFVWYYESLCTIGTLSTPSIFFLFSTSVNFYTIVFIL